MSFACFSLSSPSRSGLAPFIALLVLFSGLIASVPASSLAQAVPYQETFETNGEGTRYSSNTFDGGANAYFKRTNGSDIDVSNPDGYVGIEGSSFWAAEGSSSFSIRVVELQEVDLSTAGIVRVSANFATGCATSCFDHGDDELRIDYSLDGGLSWVRGALEFAATSDAVDVNFAPDTNGDGIGDGQPLTNVLQPYSFVLPASAQAVTVRVWVEVGDNEEIAFDNIRLTEVAPVGVPFTEDFEVDGNGTTYFPTLEFDDGDVPSAAYFKRTDGSDVTVETGPYSGFSGSFFWAAADLDDSSGLDGEDLKSLTLPEVDVSGEDAVRFVGLFGAGDYTPETPDAAGSYDLNDSLVVRYSTDGGATFQRGLKFAYDPVTTSGFNQAIGLDTNFDGEADGALLTPTLQPFSFDLPSSANTVIVRIDTYLQNGSEQLAFDNLRVEAIEPNPIQLVEPIADRAVRRFDTRVVFDVDEVFEDQNGDPLTLSAASSNPSVLRTGFVNANQWLEIEGLELGSSVVTLTAQNANGNINSTTFNVRVTTSGPVLDVDVRIAPAAEVCTDPAVLESCSDVSPTGDGFGGLRRDTIVSDPGAPVAITYYIENTGTLNVTTLNADDPERGPILTDETLNAGDTRVVTQVFDAPRRPGALQSNLRVTAIATDNVAASRYDVYRIETPVPRVAVDVLLEEAVRACDDPSDITTCDELSTTGPTPTGLRTDTVAVAVNQSVLEEYLVTNTGQTTLTALSIELYAGKTFVSSVPVDVERLAPGDTVRVRRVSEASGVTERSPDPVLVLAVGTDLAGTSTPSRDDLVNREGDLVAIWTPEPSVGLDALIGIAGEYCTDDNEISSCQDLPRTAPTPTGGPRDTVQVTAGDRLFVQYLVINRGFARLTEIDLIDDGGDAGVPSPIVSALSVDLAPRDTVVIERLYDLPAKQGDSYINPRATGRDAGGTETARRPLDLLGIFAGEADAEINALVGRAADFCDDVTDTASCTPIPRDGSRPSDGGRVDTLTVVAGTPIVVEYVVTNTSSSTDLTTITIKDSEQGIVRSEATLSLAPQAEYVGRAIFDAPTVVQEDPYIFVASVEAVNTEGTILSNSEVYGLRIQAPAVSIESLVAPADEFCSDLSDITTCTDIPNTGDSFGGLRSDTAVVYAGEPVYAQYRITNIGNTEVASVRVEDRNGDAPVSQIGLTLAPGQELLLEERFDGPTSPGISVFARLARAEDASGTGSFRTRESGDAIAFKVTPPSVTLNALIGAASEFCDFATGVDVSNCSTIPTGGDTPTGERRDTLDALPSGARFLVRYIIENTGPVDVTGLEVRQSLVGTDLPPTTVIPSTSIPALAPGESYSESALFESKTMAGLARYGVRVSGQDPSGAGLALKGSNQLLGVQTAGPAFRTTTLSGPASVFCENVTDPTTCSLTRKKRAAETGAAVAKLSSDLQAVRYAFYNDGTVEFVEHSLFDDVAGVVFSDRAETVAPLDSLIVFRISDDVASIGATRMATWIAVTSDGEAYEDTSDEAPLPVELVQFDAQISGETVLLEWQTASEESNAGFSVQQQAVVSDASADESSGAGSVWAAVGFVEGAGTSAEARSYRFSTGALEPGEYRFRLRQMDVDGRTATSKEVTVQVGIDGLYRLTPPSPHPIRTASTLSLITRESQPVRVELYDVLGRRVATLFDGEVPGGREHKIHLDGGRLASGIYFVRVAGDRFRATERVTVVR